MTDTTHVSNGKKPLEARYIPMLGYAEAWELQKSYVKQIDKEERRETLLLLQHPPTYTVGSRSIPSICCSVRRSLRSGAFLYFKLTVAGILPIMGPGSSSAIRCYIWMRWVLICMVICATRAGYYRLAEGLWYRSRQKARIYRSMGRG